MPSSTKKSPPTRLSRADKKTKRTGEMLDAAWRLFCEKGYENTTMDDVAELAGVSRFPVYYAFGDKHNLFFELWRRDVLDKLAAIDAGMKPGAALEANLGALAQWVVDEHRRKPHEVDGLFFTVRTIGLSRPDVAEKLQGISSIVVERITAIIESSTLARGQVLRAPARVGATHVVALVNGLANMRDRVHKVTVNKADLIDAFSTLVTRKA